MEAKSWNKERAGIYSADSGSPVGADKICLPLGDRRCKASLTNEVDDEGNQLKGRAYNIVDECDNQYRLG